MIGNILKGKNDKRIYSFIKLKNNLKWMLVSDP